MRRDAREYADFERALGKDNMPESLAKFQEMKYNKDNKAFAYLQGFKRYRKDNPQATITNFETANRLKESGVKGGIHLPPQKIETKDFVFDDVHINTNRKHNISREQAESFINNSLISITKWNGEVINYYSEDGATYVNVKLRVIATSFGKEQFDERILKIIEEVTKNGKRR